jgi:hypothetical protein
MAVVSLTSLSIDYLASKRELRRSSNSSGTKFYESEMGIMLKHPAGHESGDIATDAWQL